MAALATATGTVLGYWGEFEEMNGRFRPSARST